ncbi:Hypothetical predicted protein [Octopus vulgaris]|uniref:Sodium-dependent glucose transporter 1 n=1 Tax=Octopus vulgaris TaxID=6645 RepID=A0AA36BEG6_OCTVU|nr:Hypothetical predicted protein [Octopus vulgaris]
MDMVWKIPQVCWTISVFFSSRGNVFCMRIWGQQSGPYIQAMHFAFGIGAFIAPLLAKPFLAPVISSNMTPILTHPHLHVHIPGMDAKQHLLYLRDVPQPLTWNQSTGGISTTTKYFTDSNSSVLAADNSSRTRYPLAPTLTSTSPRPKKPNSANGKFLKKNFADGQNIKTHLKQSEKNKNAAENQPNVVTTSSTTSLSMTTNRLAASANGSTATSSPSLSVDSASVTTANIKNTGTTTTTTTPTTTTTTRKATAAAATTPTTATTTTTTSTTAATAESKAVVTASVGPTPSSILQLRTVTNYVTKQKINQSTSAAANTTTNSNHVSSSSNSNNGGNNSVLTGGNSYLPSSNQSLSTENPALTTFHPQKPETFDKMLNNAIHAVKGMSHIQFAYMIIGVLLFLISIFFMCLYCYDKSYQSPVAYRCDRKHKSCFEDQGFRIQILIALFIFFFMYVGMEVTFGGFIMIFAVEQFHWNKDNSVMLTSLFWGALATGRGISIFITRCCVPCWMLVTNITLVLLASLILSFGLSHYQVLLWVGTLLFGLGLSSLFPTGMSWAESYMTMTGKATAVLIVGSALGEMILPAITGFFFTKKKMVLMYIMFSLSLLSCLCFIIMQNLASNQHRKSMRSELSSSLEQQQQVSLMNGSPSSLSHGCNGDLTCRKHVTFKLDHDRVKYDRLHSSDEE